MFQWNFVLIASLLAAFSAVVRAEANESATLATTLKSPAKRSTKASWNLEVGGSSYGDEQQQAQVTGLGLNGKLTYKLLPALELKAAAGVVLQSGYAQSRFGDNTPESGVALKEAVVVLKPLIGFSVSAGAIDQGHLSAPLLVNEQPFPGVKERLVLGSRAFNVEIKAQQTVPTSKTLSTKAVEAETTPSFTTETLALRTEAIRGLELLGYGTHFAFRSLPSTVAIESERYGNSVVPISANRSRFKYEFDGYVAGAEGKIQLSRGFKVGLEGQVIQNTKADQSYGAGQYVGGSADIWLAGDVDVKTYGGSFFTESDVTPGFYNSSRIGHNNRTGWMAGLDVTFKNAGFKSGVQYVSSELINPSTLQSRLSYIQIKFETLYDAL